MMVGKIAEGMKDLMYVVKYKGNQENGCYVQNQKKREINVCKFFLLLKNFCKMRKLDILFVILPIICYIAYCYLVK